MAFDPAFRGGVNVASADVNGDGRDDIIASPASAGGPEVLSLDSLSGNPLDSFFAFNPDFINGINVAAIDQ
jgi:hypothetical protein